MNSRLTNIKKYLWPSNWKEKEPFEKTTFIVTSILTISGIVQVIKPLGKGVLAWIVVFVQLIFPPDTAQEPFWNSQDSYKILILPFNEICEDGSGDVGYVIAERLKSKAFNDTLNIEVYYREDFFPSKNFGDSATYYLYLNSADLLIYGTSISGNCSGEGSQVCLNYETDSIVNKNSRSGYQPATIAEISRGLLQGDIDDLVFYFCGLSEFHTYNFKRSIDLLSRINKHSFVSNLLMANSLALLMEYESAIKYYDLAVSMDNQNSHVYNNLGIAYYELDIYTKAIESYNTAIELEPNSYVSIINRAKTYHKLGMEIEALKDLNFIIDKAMKDLSFIIEGAPEFIPALLLRAAIYGDNSLYEKALIDLNLIIEITPTLSIAYLNRGVLYSNLDSMDRAEMDFIRGIKLDPRSTYSHYNLGKLYMEQGKLSEAKREYDLGIENSKADKTAIIDKSFLTIYGSSKDPRHTNSQAYLNRGIINHRIAKNTEDVGGIHVDYAIKDFTSAIELDSSNALAYCRRGRLYAARRLYKLGGSDLNKAIELAPEIGCGYKYRAQAIVEMHSNGIPIDAKMKALALSDINIAISLSPEDYELYFFKGRVFDLLGREEEAQREFAKGQKLINDQRVLGN